MSPGFCACRFWKFHFHYCWVCPLSGDFSFLSCISKLQMVGKASYFYTFYLNLVRETILQAKALECC